ncbi:MAG: TRAP transporter small permease [Alphaproteobacteria bacterium]|nr:TRAP transporter small permease [Alphaproteobacteria bacterium]
MTSTEPGALRRTLNAIYLCSAVIAGAALVAITVLVTIQILARPLGLIISYTDELAGFSLAASVFLALPYTLRKGRHVRMSLLVGRLTGERRRWLEVVCLLVATGVVGFFALNSVELTMDFYRAHDVSTGSLATPRWMPQSVMSVGLVILFIAVVDDLVLLLRGLTASYMAEPESPPSI